MKKALAAALSVVCLVFGARQLVDAPRSRRSEGEVDAPPSPAAPVASLEKPRRIEPPPRRAPAFDPELVPTPERVALGPQLAGRLDAPARLAWSPTAEFEGVRSPSDLDYEHLRTSTVIAESASDGSFAFEASPPGAERGSVVWVTAPGHEALSVTIAAIPAEWAWPRLEAPTPREPVRVRVVRDGEPVAGARVRHTLSYWEAGQEEREKRERRCFLVEGTTGTDGTFAFVPGSEDNVFLASTGEELSVLWIGTPRGELTLELCETVLVTGQVMADDPLLELGTARYHVGFFDAEDLSDLEWAGSSRSVRADGTFGPDAWPRPLTRFVAARVSGGEIIPAIEQRAAPAGRALDFVLTARRGLPFVVRVTDPADEPIQGAEVAAHHWDGTSWTAAQSQLTGEDGLATVQVPAGELALSVAKPGFTSESLPSDASLFAPQPLAPKRVVLRPSGVIEGWVRIASDPVPRFSLCAWNTDQSYYRRLAFEDEEGAFRLADVPRGETIFLTAFTPHDPQSTIETVVLAGEPAQVELELPGARRARGRVLDAVTRQPLASARIQHMVGGMNGFVDYRGSEARVNADGSFELEGVHPGRGGLAFFADGYEELFLSVREDDVAVVDVGLLAMNPLAVLEIRAGDDAAGDFAGWFAWNEWNANATRFPLDAAGRVEIPSRSGHYSVCVVRPDGAVARVAGDVRSGERKTVVIDFTDGIELLVTLAEPSRDVGSWQCTAATHTREEDRITRAAWSRERAGFVLPHLAAGRVTLELRDTEGTLHALRTLALTDAPEQTLQLALGGTRHRVRLEDERGKPWAARPVTVGLEEGTGWSLRLQTDAQGEFELGPLDARRVRLFAKLGSESIAYGIPVDLEPAPSTTVVRLATDRRCLFFVHEAGQPVSGIYVHFTHALAPRDMRFFYISDERGLVRGPFLAGDEHLAAVDHPDYWPWACAARPSTTDTPTPLELFRRATLLFELERGGQPVAGVRLELQHVELGAEAETWRAQGLLAEPARLESDAHGRITLAGIPRGTYRWTLWDGQDELASGTTAVAGASEELVRVPLPLR